MSGVMTIAAIASAGVAAGSLGYGIYNGQQQAGAQKKQLQAQQNAQTEAEQQSLSQMRQSEQADNEANQKTPDLSAILSRAAVAGRTGLSSTMLTGPGGVAPGLLNLGKNTLLGS